MYIDTHAHLYDDAFMEDRAEVIKKSINVGVEKIFLPNCDIETISGMMDMVKEWPNHCFPMLGLHPCYVKGDYQIQLKKLKKWLETSDFVAIGEIGLDFYWDKTFEQEQIEAFNIQIDWALEQQLPIVIHTRDSIKKGIEVVRKKQNGNLKGIFHCFSGNIKEAKEIIDLGFNLGIGGVVTFKNSTLASVIEEIPLKHIVLETDAPYLAPTPYRGKRNESSYIPIIAEKIANIKGITIEEVKNQTTINANGLFNQA